MGDTMKKVGGNKIKCGRCGRDIITTGNRQKYCEVCRHLVKIDYDAKYYLDRLAERVEKGAPSFGGGGGQREAGCGILPVLPDNLLL